MGKGRKRDIAKERDGENEFTTDFLIASHGE